MGSATVGGGVGVGEAVVEEDAGRLRKGVVVVGRVAAVRKVVKVDRSNEVMV